MTAMWLVALACLLGLVLLARARPGDTHPPAEPFWWPDDPQEGIHDNDGDDDGVRL